MTDIRRFTLVDVMLLAVIVAAAGGLRAWYLLSLVPGDDGPGLVHVQDPSSEWDTKLDDLINHLKTDQTFRCLAPLAAEEETTAHIAPGYPWLASAVEQVPLGLGSPEAAVRWLQCALGALTAGLYFLFARRAFRSLGVAVVAGAFCAIHPYWVISTAEINDGVVASFALALCLFLGVRAGQSGGPFTSLLYGLSLVALAMVRATMLPFAFVALIWFMFRCRTLQRGGLYAFLAFLGFANGLAPWTIRNFQKMGDLVPIADSAYLHLWIGNNPHATGGPLSAQEMQKALTELAQEDTQFAPDELAKRPQEARYRKLSAPVLAEVRANPGPTLRRRLGAALAFGLGEDYFRKGRLFDEGGAGAAASIEKTSLEVMLAGALLAMLLLGLLGWRWSYGWRRLAMPASLALIWVPLPYLLGHAEALHGPRLPLDGVLLTYAAFALMCMAPTVGGFLFRGTAAPDKDA